MYCCKAFSIPLWPTPQNPSLSASYVLASHCMNKYLGCLHYNCMHVSNGKHWFVITIHYIHCMDADLPFTPVG